MTRRHFGAMSGGTLASLVFSRACGAATFPSEVAQRRLGARPQPGNKTTATGTHPLSLGESRDAILYVPPNTASDPLPLMVLLHGAGGSGDRQLERLRSAVSTAGVAVLAPDSRGSTWDALRTDFGRDVVFLDRALKQVFDVVSVDPERLAIGGFSDGATYALSLGLINGDLFRKIVAFSPGFLVEGTPSGKPRVFVSHGKADEILPIDRCSRVIVPGLRRRGYEVTFREFDGGHEVPEPIAAEGMRWIKDRG